MRMSGKRVEGMFWRPMLTRCSETGELALSRVSFLSDHPGLKHE